MSASQIFLGIAITVAAQDIGPAPLVLGAILIVSRPIVVTPILPPHDRHEADVDPWQRAPKRSRHAVRPRRM